MPRDAYVVKQTHTLDHIYGFDGLRAIAALSVIAFHIGIPGFSLGWSGVPLFFVLSGFLITRILVHNKGEINFFSRFYSRRALRIFPIYYLLLAGTISVGLIRGWTLSDWPWFTFYLQNWQLGEKFVSSGLSNFSQPHMDPRNRR